MLNAPEFWWTLARSGIVALMALAAALGLRDLLLSADLSNRARTGAWALLLAPFLAPAVLVGYAYGPAALALTRSPGWRAAFYVGALAVKLTPVAVLTLCLHPPALSAEGRYVWGLRRPGAWRAEWGFRVRGAGRAPGIALALTFLLAFGEFELASLWNVRSWTVRLFDAQVGGLALGESLRLVAAPAGVQAAILAAALALMARPGRRAEPGTRPLPKWQTRVGWGFLALAALAGAVVPVALVLRGAAGGAWVVLGNGTLPGEIAASAGLAAVAAAVAGALARWARRRPWWVAAGLAIPGLGGALLLALGVLAVFQGTSGLRAGYDTPVPLGVALVGLLMPFALLLGWLRQTVPRAEALHLARRVGNRALLWELDGRGQFGAAFVLFCWAYFDLTAGALLAPAGWTPVFARLYNLMHYGQSAALSAMVCAAGLAPAVLGLTAAALWKRWGGARGDS